jgi:aryl-alcohol dehydrogenase-like predicted oxidoreductase
LSRRSIRTQAEASLRRLRVDCIDLYQIGWPVWPTGPSAHSTGSLDEAWEEMAALQREGKVRHLGISSRGAGQLERLHRIAPVTSVGAPYSLLRREVEQCAQPHCGNSSLGVIACSTMGSGLLTGTMTPERIGALPCNDWRRRHPFFQELALSRASRFVERLRVIANRHDCTPGAAAIAWTLRYPRVTAAVVGARRPGQVDDIVQAASIRLSDRDIEELGRR